MTLNFDISTGAAFPSQAFEEINAKLDVIIDKLNSISNDLTNIINAIPCEALKQDFRNEIQTPLESIYFALRSYFRNLQSSNKQVLSAIRSQCHSKDFGKIHAQLRAFVNDRSLTYVRSCGLYKSSNIKQWVASIENMASLFVFVIKGCEEVNDDYNSFFDFNLFKDEIIKSLDYFKTYRFPLEFIRDRSLGFSSLILNILRTKSSQNSVAELESNYDYFKWHVIRYKVDRSGHGGWEYSKFAFKDGADLSQATVCSAIHYQDPGILGGWLKALVSWCLPNLFPLNNHEINMYYTNDAVFNNVENIANLNKDKSFGYIFSQDGGNHWIETAGSSDSELRCIKHAWYTTCASRAKDYAPNQEFISGQTPIFPIP